MTYEQIKFTIEQIRKFENQKKETNQEKMYALVHRCRCYYTDMNFGRLSLCTLYFNTDTNTQEDYVKDCNAMIFALQGLLDKDKNYPTIKRIIKDIDLYKKSKSNKAIVKSIKQLYFSYSDRIKFGKVVEKTINDMNELFTINNGADKTMLEGMLNQLENYAVDLCNGKGTKTQSAKAEKLVLNVNNSNTNTNNVSQTTEINIEVEFENAIKQVEDACLPDAQEKEVLAKIQELKEIIDSKASRRTRWEKVKGFFKWVAEQGIQVASIIVPLLTNTVK